MNLPVIVNFVRAAVPWISLGLFVAVACALMSKTR